MFQKIAEILHHHEQLSYWSTMGGVIRLIPVPKRTLQEHNVWNLQTGRYLSEG